MKECFTVEIGRNTGNKPVFNRVCYCGTTACMKAELREQVSHLEKVPHPGLHAELSPGEEKEFYRKTLHSKLLCEDKNCDICNPTTT